MSYFDVSNSKSAALALLNASLAATLPGTGVATALAINVGSAGAVMVLNGALGTPSSGVVTNLTGTAGININGTVGATTPNTGAFTTLSTTGITTAAGAYVRTTATITITTNAGTVDVTKGTQKATNNADTTLTFSGAPATANTWFGVWLINSDTAAHTWTIPSSFSVARVGTITTVSVPASGSLFLGWSYDGTTYFVFCDPPATLGTGSFLLSAGTAAIAAGKTLTVSNTLTLSGTDSTTITFPTTSATLARTDAGQTFTGTQAFGAVTGTSWNGNTWATGTGTLSIAGGKTFTSSNTITLAGTDGTTMTFPPASASIGYLGAPQNSQSTAYTTVLSDAGKCIFHPVGDNNARTFTIDSNANVAFPIGTIIEFVNMAAASVTVAITADTMTLLPAGTTGSRTLAQYGRASAEKITSTSWVVSGNSALT